MDKVVENFFALEVDDVTDEDGDPSDWRGDNAGLGGDRGERTSETGIIQ